MRAVLGDKYTLNKIIERNMLEALVGSPMKIMACDILVHGLKRSNSAGVNILLDKVEVVTSTPEEMSSTLSLFRDKALTLSGILSMMLALKRKSILVSEEPILQQQARNKGIDVRGLDYIAKILKGDCATMREQDNVG